MKNTLIGLVLIIVVSLAGYLLVSRLGTTSDVVLETVTGESMTTASGLGIEVVQEGSGARAENGQLVTVHYTGTLEDGTVFDSSVTRGVPFEFVLGTGAVIAGWDEGVLGMTVGEKRRLTIPSDLAYGEQGYPGVIPGGATLIFSVELLAVN